ncbi:MAG: hypothetical protein WCF57_23960 [Pyrinomonadaceae bacterium]
MKKQAKIVLLLSLLLACAGVCFPQEQVQVLPPNPKFKHKREIKQIYDQASDQTRILLERMNIHGASTAGIEHVLGIDMAALFTFPGKTVSPPQEVKLGFFLLTTIAAGKYQLTVKADDEVLLKDSYPITSKQNYGRDTFSKRSQYLIDFEALIPYEKFQRMVNAKKVKIKVSGIDTDLSKEDMESLRDFASRMQP